MFLGFKIYEVHEKYIGTIILYFTIYSIFQCTYTIAVKSVFMTFAEMKSVYLYFVYSVVFQLQ